MVRAYPLFVLAVYCSYMHAEVTLISLVILHDQRYWLLFSLVTIDRGRQPSNCLLLTW